MFLLNLLCFTLDAVSLYSLTKMISLDNGCFGVSFLIEEQTESFQSFKLNVFVHGAGLG